MTYIGKKIGTQIGRRLGARIGNNDAFEETVATVVTAIAALYPQTRWWDADTGVTATDGNVSAWADRLLNETLTPPGTAPTRGRWWGEGRYAVAFDATGTTVLDNASSPLAALLGGSQKSTLVTLAEPQAWSGADYGIVFAATGGTLNRYEVGHHFNGNQTTAYRTPGAAIHSAAVQGQQIRACGYDGTAFKVNHNETKVTSVTAAANATLARVIIGGSIQSAAYTSKFTGLVRHVIAVPGVYLPTEQPALWARLVAALKTETTRLRVVAGRGMPMSALSANTITRSESRIRCHTKGAVTGLRLVLPSYYLAPAYTKNATSFTITAAVEYNGVNYPVTFRGASSRVIAPNDQYVVTDAVAGLDAIGGLPANATFYVRAGAECTLGQRVPVGFERVNPAFASHDQAVATNGGASQVGGTGAMSETGSYSYAVAYGPMAIIGLPSSPQANCIIIGDSIVRSHDWDGDESYTGWIQRGLFNGGRIPFMSYDRGSSTLSQFQTTNPHAYILAQWSQSKAIVQLGRNSMASGLSTLQSESANIIAGLAEAGCEVWWCLPPPETTSSDSWATTTNQTHAATYATKESFKAHLLSLVGTTLAGIIDPNPYLESPTAAGKWLPLATNDGIHPGISGLGNDTIHQQMSAAVLALASTW
jgi:hypothetical protein